jgi:hypothetical protein
MTPGERHDESPRTERNNMDILILLGILALWFILQIWVLPKLGVPT